MASSRSTVRRWGPIVVAALGVALGVFLLLTALGVGARPRRAAPEPDTVTPLAHYELQAPHVLSGVVVYGVQGLLGGADEEPPPELPPVLPSAFDAPIARYRAYAVAQLQLMEGQLAPLQAALAAGNRATAQATWRAAFADYLRLGAVYLDGQVALDARLESLNRAIDGTPGGLPGGVSNPRFTGLHRIEYGLWTGAPPRTLLGAARTLDADVHALTNVLPRAPLTPLEYATRAHEILEDATRGFLSGADVPWSGEGVLATDAGLQATEEVVATLRPLLHGTERVIPAVDTELRVVRKVMSALAAANGGQLPSNGQLTQQQSIQLDGSLGGALEALSQVPGVLETEAPHHIPSIPKRDLRVDPIDP
jgi:Imelysin